MTALRRILVVVILAAASLAFASARPAWACSCAQIDNYLEIAETAFVGVATEVDRPSNDGQTTVRFAVEDAQKGSPGREYELTAGSNSASCGYEFTEGHRYQVYAVRSATNLCLGNQDLGVPATTSEAVTPKAAAPEAAPPDRSSTGLWTTAGGVLVAAALGAFLYWRRRGSQ